MREEKVFRVGRVSIDGDLIEFEAEPELSFRAGRRDAVSVGVEYRYRERSDDEETVLIRITAHLDGQGARTEEASIRDHPAVDDSRRGFLSVPVPVAASGQLRGRFVVEARYGSGPWRKPAEFEVEGRHEGEFLLHVQ